MKESWKKIDNFSDYEISNLGRVKSFKYVKERILKPGKCRNGYLISVTLMKNKKRNIKSIHRLVLENFNPVLMIW